MKPAVSQNLTALIILAIVTIALFSGMAAYRAHTYGEIRTVHAWFADLTMQFGRNWYRDGIFTLRGALFWNPDSPEFPDLASRRMHSSYPAGILLPVYAAALLTFTEPGPSHVLFVVICSHFILTLCCALIVFLYTLRANGRPVDACIFGCVPVILLCFLPAPFYYFDKCYFSYEAVLPLIGIYMLLEMLRETPLRGRLNMLVRVAQYAIAFLGTFTEWLFLLFGAAIFLKRLLTGEFGRRPVLFICNTFFFCLPFGAALLIFILQVLCLGGYEYIQNRFLFRTGMSKGMFLDMSTINPFWERHMYPLFGATGITALLASAAILVPLGLAVLLRRILHRPTDLSPRTALWIGFATVIPCLVHVELLREQSSFYLHGFEALKFIIPLSLLPLVLLPLALLRSVGLNWSRWTVPRAWIPSILPLLALSLALGYVFLLHENLAFGYRAALPPSDKTNIERAQFLDNKTKNTDVIFTSSVDLVQTNCPLYAAYSMKLVYEAHSLYDVYKKVQPIENTYDLCFFNPTEKPPEDPALADLVAQGETVGSFGANTLKRLSKEQFMSAYKKP